MKAESGRGAKRENFAAELREILSNLWIANSGTQNNIAMGLEILLPTFSLGFFTVRVQPGPCALRFFMP